ncbi:MAG: hypothetical protein KIS62_04585 [Ramlibacter sp.]|nr:hypothetical protein [Ramlibacter sp.]MCW5649001.1 hypothetical protein [Ramlibacter sp.]
MRALILLASALACATLPALAADQIAPQPLTGGPDPLQKQEQPAGRNNPQIERIRVEDAGSRVDELRVGGETRSITVQPKNGLPEYEMQATDGARARMFARDGLSSANGQRVWNVFKF